MSAPSLFDQLLVREVRPPAGPQVLDPYPQELERRSTDRVAVLSREHDALCRNATDPLEIAAGLEAAGMSDRRVRAGFEAANVFELAEQLFSRVPRRPEAATRPDHWARPRRELLARGLVYALPGLLLVGAVRHLDRTESLVLLLVSVMAAAANQGLSHLTHVLRSRRQPRGESTLLRHALVGSVIAGVEIAAFGLLIDAATWRGALVALLATTYLTAATVVMLLERHNLLLVLLGPAALLGLLVVLPGIHLDPGLALAGSLVTLLAAFGAAWHLATQVAGEAGPLRHVPLSRADLRSSLPQVAHGALSMCLLSAIPYAALHSSSSTAVALAPVMLPAVLSLGVAEVHLFGFRRHAGALLAGQHVGQFARTVRWHLLGRVLAYTLLLELLSLALVRLSPSSLAADPDATQHLATYLLLAVGLFLASLLISSSHVQVVVAVEAAAFGVDAALQHLGVAAVEADLVTSALLAATMVVVATALLGRVVSHR